MTHRSILILPICLGLALLAANVAADNEALVLSVVPRSPPPETHREWSPFVERLSRDIGRPVTLKIFRGISEYEQFTLSGNADLSFSNPYQFVQLHHRQGFIPLVRDDAERLSGALVVRKTDSVQSVRDLDGQIIAFPHPNAFGASLYMRALLTTEFGIRFTPTYVASHGNVYRSVILDKARAGGGVNVTLNKEPPAVREQLRVLYETPGLAPHPLSAHPRVPAELRDKIKAAVLHMASDEAGRAILARVTLTKPVAADYPRDYQVLERLHLEKYYVESAD